MTPIQDEAFTAFLHQKANEAQDLGYRPNDFRRMLNAQGGAETVRRLLSKNTTTEGFKRLWELGRLDLSVEAIAVESRWRPFLDEVLVLRAERWLRESSYTFTPFNESTATVASFNPIEPVALSAARPSVLPVSTPRPERTQPSMSFSAFCSWLGAPLRNRNDRWCGYNPERGLGVFNLWADRLQGGRYLLWNDAVASTDTRIGAKELGQVLRSIMAEGHAAYGILSEAVNVEAPIRKRGYFDDQELLVLRLEATGRDILAHVLGVVPAADVAAARLSSLAPFNSAIDDLDVPPPGQPAPQRSPVRGGTGYRRDAAVRSYVIQRAEGRCEHCGTLGFEMADGTFYVEAHHVIALAKQGPDTVDNVIALCPEHHRQAHYGKNAEALEEAFVSKLLSLGRR